MHGRGLAEWLGASRSCGALSLAPFFSIKHISELRLTAGQTAWWRADEDVFGISLPHFACAGGYAVMQFSLSAILT